MASPIEPEVCMTTGRLLTEWFEFPEYTDEQLYALACETNGVTPETAPTRKPGPIENDQDYLAAKITAFVSARKRTRWRNNMNMQEVQARMNEATKMVNPDNFKFLPDEVRDRTGLEINPLWMMECLIRSGVLSPKEQVAALKDLATYTHSKAPSINHTTHTEMKPEDWLLELAKEEYKVLEVGKELTQPMTPIERGAGRVAAKRDKQRYEETQALNDFGSARLAALEAEFEDFDLDE
jgi:hypothetical protein